MKRLHDFSYILCLCILAIAWVPAFADEVVRCSVKDTGKHGYNIRILKGIIEEELSAVPNYSSQQKADYLLAKTTAIARKLLQKGFCPEAYGMPEFNEMYPVSFTYFPVWEGERQQIPVTFLIYAWPAQRVALRYNPHSAWNCLYATPIHSHPIPCSLAVIQGSVVQTTFRTIEVGSTRVRPVVSRTLLVGEGEADDLKETFIHQIYSNDTYLDVSLTLHAYQLPTAAQVMNCFRVNSDSCTYFQ